MLWNYFKNNFYFNKIKSNFLPVYEFKLVLTSIIVGRKLFQNIDIVLTFYYENNWFYQRHLINDYISFS